MTPTSAIGAAEVRVVNDPMVSSARRANRASSATGWVLTVLVGLFLLIDGGARVAGFKPYVDGLTQFGYPTSLAMPIGLSLMISTLLMLVPRTAILGSIPVTEYLGGATATQVRVQDAWFQFPGVLGAMAWLGLYLRDGRVRELIPLRR